MVICYKRQGQVRNSVLHLSCSQKGFTHVRLSAYDRNGLGSEDNC